LHVDILIFNVAKMAAETVFERESESQSVTHIAAFQFHVVIIILGAESVTKSIRGTTV